MKNRPIYIITLLLSVLVFSQRPIPAPEQTQPIAITNAEIHVGNGEVLENASILFDRGIITGINTVIPNNAIKIDGKGKKIYPGFILLNNILGLVEIEATRATADLYESNAITPEIRTMIAFNTDSHVIPTVRTNGILLTQPVMKNGILTCTSSIMQLDGWNWEDAVVQKDNVLHLFWPRKFSYFDDKRASDYKDRRKKNLQTIQSLFSRAKSYQLNQQPKDYKLDAILPVFEGKKKLFINVAGPDELFEILDFTREFSLKNVVLLGSSNLLNTLDEIKKSGFPLLIDGVHELPNADSDTPMLPYEFAKKVSDKGILYGLDYGGRMEYQNARNLPFMAGTTVTFGVSKEEALKSITLNIAKIVGIEDRYGSLEVGKSATLFISNGDALDQLSNDISHAFIYGRALDLTNQQKKLYETYQEKYKINLQKK